MAFPDTNWASRCVPGSVLPLGDIPRAFLQVISISSKTSESSFLRWVYAPYAEAAQ